MNSYLLMRPVKWLGLLFNWYAQVLREIYIYINALKVFFILCITFLCFYWFLWWIILGSCSEKKSIICFMFAFDIVNFNHLTPFPFLVTLQKVWKCCKLASCLPLSLVKMYFFNCFHILTTYQSVRKYWSKYRLYIS